MELLPLFGHGAVFQQHQKIIIRGKGKGTIHARFLGKSYSTCAREGEFELILPPHAPGGPWEMELTEEGQTIIIQDIFIGDVIFLAGQSNAELPLRETDYQPLKNDGDEKIRIYHQPQPAGPHPMDGGWFRLTDENKWDFPAIGFHVARHIRQARGVAVGIVCCYQGASVIQSFLPPQQAGAFQFPCQHPDHVTLPYARWNQPSFLYERMLLPLVPFSHSAVIWYQGESNTSPEEGAHYEEMLEGLIWCWRDLFDNSRLPFIIVGINDYDSPFSTEGWSAVQLAQQEAARRIPDCVFAPIADLGEHQVIHPRNKEQVSQRIWKVLENMLVPPHPGEDYPLKEQTSQQTMQQDERQNDTDEFAF